MNAESRSRLEALLDRHERTAAPPAAVQQQVIHAEVPFAVAFERVREEVILPALREFAAILESRGQHCELIEGLRPGHHPELATTGLRHFPPSGQNTPVGRCPVIKFSPEPGSGNVLGTVSNPGPGEGSPTEQQTEYSLQQMTAAVVEAEVLRLLEAVFSR
jgi:hypothetical protein